MKRSEGIKGMEETRHRWLSLSKPLQAISTEETKETRIEMINNKC